MHEWRETIEAVGAFAVGGLLIAAIAVPWHRRVLARGADESPIRAILVYAAAAVALELGLNVPGLLIGSIEGAIYLDYLKYGSVLPIWLRVWVASIWWLFLVASGYVLSRVMLVLPAIAIDEPRATLVQAWSLSRGNGWRLAFGNLVAFVPALAAWTLGSLLIGRSDAAIVADQAIFWAEVVANAFYFALARIALAFLSIAYRELAMKKAAG